jgi:intergrase/recombinase
LLSKYLGTYLQFKEKLKQYGIKWAKPDNFQSFLNIFSNSHSDLGAWYKQVYYILPENQKLYPRFMLLSGLRRTEGRNTFNKVIELSKQKKLHEYYDSKLSILEHFRYPKEFLRNTKNAYISIVPHDLIIQIGNSKPISDNAIRKFLERKAISLRIKELRSYHATYLAKHGIMSEIVDLLQGRIGRSVFVRNYLKEDSKQLSEQVLKLLQNLEQSFNN